MKDVNHEEDIFFQHISSNGFNMAAMAEPVDRSTDMYRKKAYGSLDESVKKDIDLASTARTDILEILLQTVEERRLVCLQMRTKTTLPNGKVIILYEVIGKIAHWVMAFKAVGDVVLQCNPATAGLSWAALQFLLQAAITDKQIEGLIVANLETVSRMIAKRVREHLFDSCVNYEPTDGGLSHPVVCRCVEISGLGIEVFQKRNWLLTSF